MAKSYSSEEVILILKRVRESGADLNTFTEEELREIAAEAGLNPDDVGPAAIAMRRDRSIQEEVSGVLRRRRAGWWSSVTSYLLVNTGLGLVDWFTGPGWWVQWVLCIWGVVVALEGKKAFLPNRLQLEESAGTSFDKAQKKAEREAARKHGTTPSAFVSAIDEMAAKFVHVASDKIEDAIRGGVHVRVDDASDWEDYDTSGPNSPKRRKKRSS